MSVLLFDYYCVFIFGLSDCFTQIFVEFLLKVISNHLVLCKDCEFDFILLIDANEILIEQSVSVIEAQTYYNDFTYNSITFQPQNTDK